MSPEGAAIIVIVVGAWAGLMTRLWLKGRERKRPPKLPLVAEVKTDAPLREVRKARPQVDDPGFDAGDGASRGNILRSFEFMAEGAERNGPVTDEALRIDVQNLMRAVTRGYLTVAEAQRFAERLAGSSARLMTVGVEPDPVPPDPRDARRRAALEQWAEEQERMAEIMFDKVPTGPPAKVNPEPKTIWTGGDPYAFPTAAELAKMEGVTIYEPPKPVTRAKLALGEDV